MSAASLRQTMANLLRDRKLWLLLAIFAVGAYLRIWHIDNLLHYYVEYDEGVLSLQARFFAEGYLPYRDFILVQPPFYYMLMAGVYKVFGYSLFYAKYLSIFLSLATLVLIYMTGKKLYHPGVGLVAAGLFAVSPDMVYVGRRVVQEPLGIFLIVLALYCLAFFIADGRKKALIASGLALGLAVATKYLFAPAVLAVFLVLIIYLMDNRTWDRLKQLARPSFLFTYALVTAVTFTLLFIIYRGLSLPLSVPLFDFGDFSSVSVLLACCISILTLFLTMLIMQEPLHFREWWGRLRQGVFRREVCYLAAGVLLGFIAATGYFWIRAPQEFFYQTLILQSNRTVEFPSFISVMKGALCAWAYLKIAFLPILLSLPVALIMLNRKYTSRADWFIALSIIVALLFCQFLSGQPRYYYAVYPFLLLGLASFIPAASWLMSTQIKDIATDTRIKLMSIAAIAIVFLGTSIMVVVEDPGYDCAISRLTSNEEYAYINAIEYLESASPDKVYSTNPIILALAPQLNSTQDVDTFALLGLKEDSAEQLIQDQFDQGVDFFVVDYWARRLLSSDMNDELEAAITQHARLVQRIDGDSINYIDIYQLVPEGQTFLNGDFSRWADSENTLVPVGWQLSILGGDMGSGDSVTITQGQQDGRQCLMLSVSEEGQPQEMRDITFCRLYQEIPWPQNDLLVDIMPTFSTTAEDDAPRAGMIFVGGGHNLIITFPDAIDSEQFLVNEGSPSATVIRPAALGQWSQQSIDLAAYWAQAGWSPPDEVAVSFFVSAHCSYPGIYDLYIAGVAAE